MEIKVEIGDVVLLKSGSPLMTAISAADDSGMVNCAWFNRELGMKLEYGKFHFKTLKAKID